VRDQNQIDMLKRGDFVPGVFENRIREPRIDEQNFSARGHNLESRLTIPSKLGIHGNYQIEKHWSSKRNAVQEVTVSSRQISNRRLPKPSLLGFSAFDIRDSSFYL
jgi:hypothetical protein